MRASKTKGPSEKWRLFGNKVRRQSVVLLLKQNGCVLKK
jgi:hypothetical protein